ncbi:MAG: diguanylate cyclase [Peptostreptococcaceae bacterium]|nr:diguanylate cyclase [Peptostreptococcaceae bacterium]
MKKILENKKKLNNTNQVMEEILEATHVGIWEWNVQTGETIFNERWAEIIGYTLDEISPTSIETWIRFTHPDDIKKSDEQLERIFSNVQEYYEIECRIKHKDGSWIWINDRGKVVTWTNDGKPLTMRGTHSDITKSKREEEKNIYLGYHDFLTGVYNRRFYEEELRRLDTERNLPLTIAMGDLNGLKLINDSFGHHMGDEFLKKVAELIKETCRADDIVSRVGGDEFVIILPKTDGLEAGEIINRIYKSVSEKRVENLKFSISFGYETKTEMGQKIEDVFKGAEDHMYRHKLYESNSIKSQMIDLIMNTLHEKNPRESLHSKRVSEICESIAKGMGLDNENINKIRVAGLMHDIGKIGIDEKALNSVGKLNDEEWKEIKKHPEISYRILGSAKEFSEIAMFALDHHERWDGSGYPNRLREKEISLPARIIAVADAFDAMIGERSYRESISEEDAMKEIIKCSGTQFDPYIVEIFVKQSLKEL